jgi:hypothetical protein
MAKKARRKKIVRVGRPRRQDVERRACGKIKYEPREIVPVAALEKRAESVGLNLSSVKASDVGLRLCQDQSAGTVLGRLMWKHESDGTRERRMMVVDGECVPVITDAMATAADVYRSAWAEWHRASEIPRRHPQAADVAVAIPTTGDDIDDTWAEKATERYADMGAVLHQCQGWVLVRALLENVVIENVGRVDLILERPVAINALRRGLSAIADVFVHGKKRVA